MFEVWKAFPELCSEFFESFVDTSLSCIFSSSILIRERKTQVESITSEFLIPEAGINAIAPYLRENSKINMSSYSSYVRQEAKEEGPIVDLSYKIQRLLKYSETADKIFYCRILDSFEYYLSLIATEIIVLTPSLMAPEQKNSPEFSIKASDMVAHLASPAGVARSIAMSYIDSKDKGAGYKSMIKIYNKFRGTKESISEEEISFLEKLYETRNSITHENGSTDAVVVSVIKADLNLEDYVDLFGPLGLIALVDYMLKICKRTENFLSVHIPSISVYPSRNIALDHRTAIGMSYPLIASALKRTPQSP